MSWPFNVIAATTQNKILLTKDHNACCKDYYETSSSKPIHHRCDVSPRARYIGNATLKRRAYWVFSLISVRLFNLIPFILSIQEKLVRKQTILLYKSGSAKCLNSLFQYFYYSSELILHLYKRKPARSCLKRIDRLVINRIKIPFRTIISKNKKWLRFEVGCKLYKKRCCIVVAKRF